MPTPLRKLPDQPAVVGYQNITAGQWWYCPWLLMDDGSAPHYLSQSYNKNWLGKRPPVTLMLPGGREWCIDQKSDNGPGWVVTGEEGLWTATPSISVPGFAHEGKTVCLPYHGWLKEGVLSDDISGQKYPALKGR